MKILVVTPTFFPIVGGAELLIYDVFSDLSTRHEVRIITPHLPKASAGFWVDDLSYKNMPFKVERFSDRRSLMRFKGHRLTRGLIPPLSFSGIKAVRAQMATFAPDCVVNFFAIPLGLGSLALAKAYKVPFVLVLCGTELPGPRTEEKPHWRNYVRLIVEKSDRVIYVSRFCHESLGYKKLRPFEKVIYGGVDFSKSAVRQNGVRQKLGIGDKDTMLFALQRLGPEKRVDVLIRAMAFILREAQDVRLVIGGQGPEEENLKKLAADLAVADKVIFTGHLGPEKSEYYAACDIFIFHSLFETFGQVLAEAMAAGKPIVSVTAGAIKEVVDHGVNGLLVKPKNPQALAKAVVSLIKDKQRRRSLGVAGLRKAVKEFDWTNSLKQWQEVLEEVELPVFPNESRFGQAGLEEPRGN